VGWGTAKKETYRRVEEHEPTKEASCGQSAHFSGKTCLPGKPSTPPEGEDKVWQSVLKEE